MRKSAPIAAMILVAASCGASMAADAITFPLASCTGTEGTVTSINGVNTKHAMMTGVITDSNLREYCTRDPGAMTIASGGKLSMDQCIAEVRKEWGRPKLIAEANCPADSIKYRAGITHGYLKLPATDDSCPSGFLPMITQFQMLCPIRDKQIKDRADKANAGRQG